MEIKVLWQLCYARIPLAYRNEGQNTSNLVSDWYLRIDVARVKEMMAKKEIQIECIKGKEQVADWLTKVKVLRLFI